MWEVWETLQAAQVAHNNTVDTGHAAGDKAHHRCTWMSAAHVSVETTQVWGSHKEVAHTHPSTKSAKPGAPPL